MAWAQGKRPNRACTPNVGKARPRCSRPADRHIYCGTCSWTDRTRDLEALVIAAKRETIRSPGGYLRGMISRAHNGELHLSNSCRRGNGPPVSMRLLGGDPHHPPATAGSFFDPERTFLVAEFIP